MWEAVLLASLAPIAVFQLVQIASARYGLSERSNRTALCPHHFGGLPSLALGSSVAHALHFLDVFARRLSHSLQHSGRWLCAAVCHEVHSTQPNATRASSSASDAQPAATPQAIGLAAAMSPTQLVDRALLASHLYPHPRRRKTYASFVTLST